MTFDQISSASKRRLSVCLTPQGLVRFAIVIGLLARLYLYLSGRMLWQDEAMLAVNLATRSGSELFEPFTFTQIAPIGWILLTDWLHAISGDFEIIARLPGFVASCLTLLLVPRLVRQLFTGYTVSVLVGLFAVSGVLIDYTAQLKPYALDVLLCTAMLIVCLDVLKNEDITKQNIIALPIIGLFAAFFTFTAPFVLGGFGGVLILKNLVERRWKVVMYLIPVLGLAGLIYIALGLGLYQGQANSAGFHSGYAANYYENLYAPFPITGAGDVTWYAWWGISVFEFFAGYQSSFLWIFCGLAGAYLMGKKSMWTLAMLLAPLVLSILISYPQVYPLLPRVNLYYLPILVMLMGETLHLMLAERENLETAIAAGVLFLALAAGSAWSLTYFNYFNLKAADSDLSAELSYLQKKADPDEVILVDRNQIPAYLVYRKAYGLEQNPWAMIEIREDCKRAFLRELRDNESAWVLTSPERNSVTSQSNAPLIYTADGIRIEQIDKVAPFIEHIRVAPITPQAAVPSVCDMPFRLSDEEMLAGVPPLWPGPDMWKSP